MVVFLIDVVHRRRGCKKQSMGGKTRAVQAWIPDLGPPYPLRIKENNKREGVLAQDPEDV